MDLARLGFRVDTGDLSRARSEVGKLSSAFTNLIALVGVGLSLDKTISTIMDFEDSMLSLQATSNATADEMARLEKQARSLGATTRYSAKEAADAQNFLAMAGFNTSKILAATGDVINFASAANLGLAQSANIASGALSQMGLGVESLTDVMDAMVNVSQSAGTDVAQIAEAMKYAGRTAASVGLDIAETAAVIGVLGDNSLVGSQAGTSLLGVFRQLLVVTPQNEKVLAGYNLTVKDLDITTRGLIPVMRDLQAAQINPKDYIMLFGEAANAAMAIAETTDRIVEITEANRSLSGVTKETANIMDSGLSAALAAVNSASEEAMIQFGQGKNGLGGVLKTLAVTTAGVINAFNGFSDEFNKSNGVSVEFAKKIELVAEGVKYLAAIIATKLTVALISSAAAFSLAKIQAVQYMYMIARVQTITRAAAAQTVIMNLAMAALPHVALVAGVVAITYAFTQYNNQMKETARLADEVRAKVAAYNAEQNSVEGLQARLKAEEETLAAIQATAAAHEAGTSQAAQSLEKLRGMIKSGNFSGDTLAALVQNYEKIQASIESTTAKVEGSKQRIADLKEALAALGVQTDDTAAKLNSFGQSAEQIEAILKIKEALIQEYMQLQLSEDEWLSYNLAKQGATAADIKAIVGLNKYNRELKANIKAAEEAELAAKDYKKELEDFSESVRSAIDPLHDIEKAMTKAWAAHAKGLLSDKEIKKYIATFSKGTKEIVKNISAIEAFTDEAAKRIDTAFADAWANIDDGFGGLVDGIKNSFKTMLAEMAHEALTRPILLNIQQNAGSLFGAADAATKTASDAAGGAAAAGGVGVMAGAIAAGALVTVAAINSHNKKDDERMMKYTSEYRQGQQSTGTVLGDIDAKSHSLSNLTESLVEMGTDTLDVNHGMLRSLQAIESGIKGASQGIARQLSSAGGLEDFESTTSTSTIIDKRLGIEKFMLNPFGSGLDKIGLGFIDDFLGGLMGSISKGIYSKKKSLQDAGIDFANQTLGAIIDSGFVEADAYQQIKTTRKTLGVKKSSTSKETSDLDDAIQYQLGSIFSKAAGVLGDVGTELGLEALNYSKTIGGKMLGMRQKTIEIEMGLQELIENLEIDAGELSLKDLKGDELSAAIESFISSNLDNWAESILKAADMEGVAAQYQQAGEGVFQTLGRLVAQSKNLQQTAERLNLQFNASGLEAAELTQKLAGMAGGFSNLQALTSSYYQEYFSDAEKQANLQRDLTRAFAEYNTELPRSKEAFRSLVESVDLTTESGQQAYIALMNVQAPFAQYVDALKKAEKAENDRLIEIERSNAELEKAAEISRKFNESINQQIQSFGLAGQALDDFNLNKWFDETKKSAEIAGGDMIAVEKLYWLKRTEISEKYAEAALNAELNRINALKAFNDQIQSDLEAFGVTGLQAELLHLDREFKGIISKAIDVGGDLVAVEELYGKRRTEIIKKYNESLLAMEGQQFEEVLQGYLSELAGWSSDELARIEADYRERIALAEQQMRIGRELRQYVEQLRISELSPYDPGAKLQLASESFAKLLVQAEAGDLEAAAKLQGAANTYLETADSYYGRSDAYVSIFDDVTNALDELGVDLLGDEDKIERLTQQMLTEQQKIKNYVSQQLVLLVQSVNWAATQYGVLTTANQLLAKIPGAISAQLGAIIGGGDAAVAGSMGSLTDMLDKLIKQQQEAAKLTTVPTNDDAYTNAQKEVEKKLAESKAIEDMLNRVLDMWAGLGGGGYDQQALDKYVKKLVDGGYSEPVRDDLIYYKKTYDTMQQVLDLWNSSGGGEYDPAELDRYVKGVVDTGGSVNIDDLNWYRNTMDGSHANGLDSVPFDGYRAELHQNEMVLPASVADHIRTSMSSGNTTVQQDNRELVSELQQLRAEVVNLKTEQQNANARAAAQRNEQKRSTDAVARNARQVTGVL